MPIPEPFPSPKLSSSPLANKTSNVSSPSTSLQSSLADPRRSNRVSQRPTWLSGFVSLVQASPAYASTSMSSGNNHFSNSDSFLFSPTYTSFLKNISSVPEPCTFHRTSQDPNWVTTMEQKLNALDQHSTWQIIDLPKGKKPIGSKWEYRVKYKSTNEVDRYKTRLVAKCTIR